MATTPEGKVKLKVDKWIKENLIGCFKYKPAGTLYSTTGVGDYIIVYLSTPIMIEVKKDHSNKPTALQNLSLKTFSLAGGISCVLYGFEVEKLQMIKSMCEARHAMIQGAK